MTTALDRRGQSTRSQPVARRSLAGVKMVCRDSLRHMRCSLKISCSSVNGEDRSCRAWPFGCGTAKKDIECDEAGIMEETALLRLLFEKAVAAADPMRCVPAALPEKPAGRVVVVGAGKGSARMAEAIESAWGPMEGLVLTRYGYGRPCQGINIVEAAHPVPDAAGFEGTRRMLDLLKPLGADDTVVALISGGASALLVQPAGDITLQEKQALNAALLRSGASIDEMNIVRKHVSRVKGGQLAGTAFPARMITLLISDVAGDDPAFIGSGPTVGDASSPQDALAILERYGMDVPQTVFDALRAGSGILAPDDPKLAGGTVTMVAAPSMSIAAAARVAEAHDLTVDILGDAITGEARDVAAEHAALALAARPRATASGQPVLLLSGGECTVTQRGSGLGGPNAEYALALAIALNGAAGIYALACDTDGVDGAADVAGAIVTPDTLARAKALGIDPKARLDDNDSHRFFEALGDQVVPGPTLTNVNDLRAILIMPDV